MAVAMYPRRSPASDAYDPLSGAPGLAPTSSNSNKPDRYGIMVQQFRNGAPYSPTFRNGASYSPAAAPAGMGAPGLPPAAGSGGAFVPAGSSARYNPSTNISAENQAASAKNTFAVAHFNDWYSGLTDAHRATFGPKAGESAGSLTGVVNGQSYTDDRDNSAGIAKANARQFFMAQLALGHSAPPPTAASSPAAAHPAAPGLAQVLGPTPQGPPLGSATPAAGPTGTGAAISGSAPGLPPIAADAIQGYRDLDQAHQTAKEARMAMIPLDQYTAFKQSQGLSRAAQQQKIMGEQMASERATRELGMRDREVDIKADLTHAQAGKARAEADYLASGGKQKEADLKTAQDQLKALQKQHDDLRKQHDTLLARGVTNAQKASDQQARDAKTELKLKLDNAHKDLGDYLKSKIVVPADDPEHARLKQAVKDAQAALFGPQAGPQNVPTNPDGSLNAAPATLNGPIAPHAPAAASQPAAPNSQAAASPAPPATSKSPGWVANPDGTLSHPAYPDVVYRQTPQGLEKIQ